MKHHVVKLIMFSHVLSVVSLVTLAHGQHDNLLVAFIALHGLALFSQLCLIFVERAMTDIKERNDEESRIVALCFIEVILAAVFVVPMCIGAYYGLTVAFAE